MGKTALGGHITGLTLVTHNRMLVQQFSTLSDSIDPRFLIPTFGEPATPDAWHAMQPLL